MNEFTKEELEIVRWYLQKEIPTPPDYHLNLLIKIQSMIDNYCEHEHIPNEETAQAIEEARNDLLEKNKHYRTGINLVCGKCNQNVNSFRIRYDNKQQAYIVTAYCHGEKEVVHEDAFLDLNLNGTFFDWGAS
jgi:hypothetical protein